MSTISKISDLLFTSTCVINRYHIKCSRFALAGQRCSPRIMISQTQMMKQFSSNCIEKSELKQSTLPLSNNNINFSILSNQKYSIINSLNIKRQAHVNHSETHNLVKPFILPDIGEGINEVIVREWLIKEGDFVKEFDPICEVESDKATATITSRFQGIIAKIHHETGAKAKVGKPLIDILVSGSQTINQQSDPTSNNDATSTIITPEDTITSSKVSGQQISNLRQPMLPSVRRLAQERDIDLAKIRATGKNGRVLKEDIMRHLASKELQSETKQKIQESITIMPMNGIKRAMYKTMTKSLKIPHFNYADEIDMTRLLETSKRRNNDSLEHLKVSNLAIIVKMLSLALLKYPELNASLEGDEGERLLIKNYHNIGVAIDTKAGLLVPNIKNVQELSIEQINSELSRLRELGYNNKLGTIDLTGATITLSNIGAIGGTFGVPVIVSPEIAIVALGKIRKLPRFRDDGQIEARHVVQIVWSADHRCVDGATLSRFSNLFKHYLENPDSALLKLA